jgi:hypothetical protein
MSGPPFQPAAFERVDFLEAQHPELACHTDTRGFVVSGAIENDGELLWVFFGPGFHVDRVFAQCAPDLQGTVPVVSMDANIDYQHLLISQ